MRRKDKVLTLYFTNVEEIHLGKDVFLAPYYLGKELGYKVRIIYPMTETNRTLPSEYRGVQLLPMKMRGDVIHSRLMRRLVMLSMWFRYIMHSDVFMIFHYYDMRTPYMGVFYKLLHPHGKLYVKMDASLIALKDVDDYRNWCEKAYKNFWHWMFAKVVNCITCETRASYNLIMHSRATMYKFRNQLFIMPNAFDDETLAKMNIQVKTFGEKKNQFITVGRIGAPEKNNEMLLKALEKVNMEEWSMIVVGPYDESFAQKISAFYRKNPDKRQCVKFLGNVSDKKNLWELYNKSKVFVFTSKTESSALVFVEANAFHNYIVSTNVGSFLDIVKDGEYGECVQQNDIDDLALKMQNIIEGKTKIDCYDNNYKGMMWSEIIKPVAVKLRNKE